MSTKATASSRRVATQKLIAVQLPEQLGAVSVGGMRPNHVYHVTAPEAKRLVEAKGFKYATPKDAAAAATSTEAAAATTTNTNVSDAAPAPTE